MNDPKQLLDKAIDGDRDTKSALFVEMYEDLRRLAHARLKKAGPVVLLDTTSLVHESYLRFLGAGSLRNHDRSRFLAYAARVMRSVVVDFVRESQAKRRGGEAPHVTLNTAVGDSVAAGESEVLRVSEALDALARTDERLVRIVEMKYFAGYNEQDIAACLGTSERTLRREWRRARLLLFAALK
jgi:RNA polymerase sigma factor (TIGR02999 family)